MSRSRNIKPGFFRNDLLAECEPLARLLFAALWCEADREGRLEDRPKRIKAACLPYDDCDVDALLDQLHARGFIVRYVVDSVGYIAIKAFCTHQNPHMREPASTLPEPPAHSASTVQAPDKHSASTEPARLIPDSLNLIPDSIQELGTAISPQAGESDVPQQAASPTKAEKAHGTRLPDGWFPSDDLVAFAFSEGMTVDDVRRETATFCDYWKAKPGKDGRKTDWDATYRNWVRRATKDRKHGKGVGAGSYGRRESEAERVERINREHDERERMLGIGSNGPVIGLL